MALPETLPEPPMVALASKDTYILHNLNERKEWCLYGVSACPPNTAPDRNYIGIGEARFKVIKKERLADIESNFFREHMENIKKSVIESMPSVAEYETARKTIETNKILNHIVSTVLPQSVYVIPAQKVRADIPAVSLSPLLAILLNLEKVGRQILEDLEAEAAKPPSTRRKWSAKVAQQIAANISLPAMDSLEKMLDPDTLPLPLFPKLYENKNILIFGGFSPVRAWELVPAGQSSTRMDINLAGNKYELMPYARFDICAKNYAEAMGKMICERLGGINDILRREKLQRAHMIEAAKEQKHIPRVARETGYYIENGQAYVCWRVLPVIVRTRDNYFIPLPQKPAPGFAIKYDGPHGQLHVDEDIKQDILQGFYIYEGAEGKLINSHPKILNYSVKEYVFPNSYPDDRLCLGEFTHDPPAQYKTMPVLDLLRQCHNILLVGYHEKTPTLTGIKRFESIAEKKAKQLADAKRYILSEEPINADYQ